MPLIDPSDLTFNGEEAKTLQDAIIESSINNPAVADLMTVYDGIITKKQIPFLGRLSKITKLDGGCGTGILSKNIPMTEKFWEPENVKIWLDMCAQELDGSFFVYLRKNGIDRDNLEGTEIASFIVDTMSDAASEDLLRIIWFNDKAAANVSGGGVIKNGVSLTDYNIINGIWKQIFAAVTADPARLVAISENALATKVLQMDLAASKALTTFQKMVASADSRLIESPDKIIIATRSIVENYATYLESQGADASFVRIENGYVTLRYRDIMIYGFNFWDRTIQADFDNGTTYDLPHRAILTTVANLAVGYDLSSDVGVVEAWYEKMTEKMNFRGKYRVDAKLMQEYMFQAAY
jgi:hypothetical protein